MVLNGAGGWENRKTLATDAKMREEGEEKERKRKGGRRWEKNPSPVHGIRHMRKITKPPPHEKNHQTTATEPKRTSIEAKQLPRKPAEVPAPDIGYEQEAHHHL
jgi:hypothetical protein